jgi:hypothetical protein
LYISPDQNPDARSATVWERIESQSGVADVLQSRAAFELKRRLQHWNGDYLPRPSRFKNKHGIDRGTHLVVRADPVELVIVRAVAMTRGAAQFGVSPNGAIFAAEGYGYTIRGPRVDVTRLSWLLDEAADILQEIRGGAGGRFYERNGRFFLAEDRTTILEVVDEPDPGVRAERPDPASFSYDSRPWWQKAVNAVFRRHWDELPQSSTQAAGPQVPDDVRRARQAPVRRRVQPVEHQSAPGNGGPVRHPGRRARPGQICPVHFILLPTNGRCDECRSD